MKIEIVENVRARMKQDDKYIKKVAESKIPIDKEKAKPTIITTPQGFSRLFSPQKIRLMLRIRKNKITNIYQLAKELGRKYEAVHRDISDLESYGLIKIKEKGRQKIPYTNEKITITAFA